MESKPQTYRVVGVNSDESVIVLDEGLTRERAEQMKRLLLEARAFPSVQIEEAECEVRPAGGNVGNTWRSA